MTKLAWVVGAVAMIAGCAGEAADDDTGEDEGAISGAALVTGAAAVEVKSIPTAPGQVASTLTFGAPTKVERFLSGMKKNSGAVPRCMPQARQEIRFLDAKEKAVASLKLSCGYGTLKVGTKETAVKLLSDAESVMSESLRPADALWGITKVSVNAVTRHKTKTVTTAAGIKSLIDTVGNQDFVEVDPNAPVARCAPSIVATFIRGTEEIATTSFTCTSSTEAKVGANFKIIDRQNPEGAPLDSGRVKLDPKPFNSLFE